ncbi:hypothetical protein [Curtobacterium sp. KT1]|uniref:DUF7169 domain-containing protein n=1 Tax=Curtobacterium sp. KT1 TaxID=3372858 RepID=UPI0037C112DB
MTTDTTAAPGKLTNPTLHQSANLVMNLHYFLGSAADAQWLRSRTISPDTPDAEVIVGAQDASTIRTQRLSDPTFDAAADPARLALREAVKAAEKAMARQHAAMQEAAGILDAALTRWNGGA